MLAPAVTLRYTTPDDRGFLARLFTACRSDEFVPLGEPFVSHVLQTQFEAQQAGYAGRFGSSGDHIITSDEDPIGRIWVHCDGSKWELVDIAVLPEHRGHGVGTVLLRDLIQQADWNGATIHLDVRCDNAGAQRLYFGLGFSLVSTDELDLRLSLRPSTRRKSQFAEFRRAVLADPKLQARLRTHGRDGFALAVADVATELGYEFDAADVRDALRDARTEWITRWV
jgi:GNAT superfamily N-acetyltransferase